MSQRVELWKKTTSNLERIDDPQCLFNVLRLAISSWATFLLRAFIPSAGHRDSMHEWSFFILRFFLSSIVGLSPLPPLVDLPQDFLRRLSSSPRLGGAGLRLPMFTETAAFVGACCLVLRSLKEFGGIYTLAGLEPHRDLARSFSSSRLALLAAGGG